MLSPQALCGGGRRRKSPLYFALFLEIKQDITFVLQILWKNFRRVRKFPYFLWKSNERFPLFYCNFHCKISTSSRISKYSEICRNKHISIYFALSCLRWQNSAKPKIFVNGICAICYIFPICSSLAITVWEWRCFEDIFTKDEGLSQ